MEEVLLTALASISCFKSYSSAPQVSSAETTANVEELLTSCEGSLAYIVGTHKDKVSEEQIDEFDKQLQSTDFFREGLIRAGWYSPSMEEMIKSKRYIQQFLMDTCPNTIMDYFGGSH